MSKKRISKLSIHNLKGAFKEIDFDKNTVFCGKNGSGKTSVLDALKLTLLGEHDELGKQGKNLRQLGSIDTATRLTLTFKDGDTCNLNIHPQGKTTARVSHDADYTPDPSLRLNLCPEEFWRKGDTARIETLLEMCGDSSLVTKEFVSNCVRRVRVSGMTEGLFDWVEKFADEANEFIVDGDISSLAKLESLYVEDRRQANNWKKNLKARGNDLLDDVSLVEVTDEEIDGVHAQIHDLLSESEKIGKKIAKEERDMARRDDLLDMDMAILEAENEREIDDFIEDKQNGEFDADPSFCRMPDTEKLLIAAEALSSVKKKIEKLVKVKSPEYTRLVDDSPPDGFMYRVKGNAVFTGSSFALVNNTVSWSKDGLYDDVGNDVGENKEALSELQITQNKLESDIEELEDRINSIQELSDKDAKFLEENMKVDFKKRIQDLHSEKETFSVRLKELQEEIEKIAENKAKMKQKKEIEAGLCTAEMKYNVVKSVLSVIRDMQKDIVSSAVNDALEIVNAVTNGIIKEKIEWDGKKIGRKINNYIWVPIDTFSGAEKAVTQMALGVALANRSNFRLTVLDEISRLDKENQEQLFRNLNELLAQDKLDQYIGFCIDAPEGCDVDVVEFEKE